MTLATTTEDPFDNPEFAPEKITLPWLQVLNNEDPDKSGLFISQENVDAAGITVPEGWQLFKARFKGGKLDRSTGKFLPGIAEGYLFNHARILVVRQGALSMYTKRAASTQESYLGQYDKHSYLEQRSNLVLKTKYLIYLLNGDNQLLHSNPLQFTTKGVFGATFAEHLRSFQAELQQAYGKQRGAKFLINGVLALETASELRGNPPNTAWVSIVAWHAKPTKENWRSLFVGYDDELREKLLADYEAFVGFGIRSEAVNPDTGEVIAASPPQASNSAPESSWESSEYDDEIPY